MPARKRLALVGAGALSCLGLVVAGYWVFHRDFAESPTSPESVRTSLTRASHSLAGQAIREVDLEATVLPEEGPIRARARLVVESLEGGRRTFSFVLNPGLGIVSATVEGNLAPFTRRGPLVTVTVPKPLAAGARMSIELVYEGAPQQTVFAPSEISVNQVLLLSESFWYPCDFQKFVDFRCSVTLPESMKVVSPVPETRRVHRGAQAEPAGFQTVTWEEPRPVFGASLIAGRFDRAYRTYGHVLCAVYWPERIGLDAGAFLEAASRAYSSLSGLLGESGFDSISVVLSDAVQEPFHGSNSVCVLPVGYQEPERAFRRETTLQKSERLFELAQVLAHNWWGGTVAGRRLSDKPEGDAWVVEGLAEYSAREALRNELSRADYLRLIERVSVPERIPVPLKTIGLLDSRIDPELHQTVRSFGGFLAQMLADYVGREKFHAACRNFLAVHRCSTVSYSSFRQELELASDMDLGEFFYAWFDRPGAFDYALADVRGGDQGVRVTVANVGEFPAFGSMRISVETGEGVEFHTIEPGAGGGSFTLPCRKPARRVVLDSEFATGDMIRANNVWPRQTWPQGLAAGSGMLAWWTAREWNNPAMATLNILEDGEIALAKAKLNAALIGEPLWSRDGKHLFWTTASAKAGGRPAVYRWVPRSQPELLGEAAVDRLIGPLNDDLLLGFRSKPESEWVMFDVKRGNVRARPMQYLPEEKTVCVNPKKGTVAYKPRGRSEVRLFDPQAGTDTSAVLDVIPEGKLAWSIDGEELLFFDSSGRLFRTTPRQSPISTILELGYEPRGPRFSPSALHAAWLDAAGGLRVAGLADNRVRYVTVPGTVIGWAWADNSALVVLTAEAPRVLPMLFHSEYVLWRVPMDSLTPARIRVNPAEFN